MSTKTNTTTLMSFNEPQDAKQKRKKEAKEFMEDVDLMEWQNKAVARYMAQSEPRNGTINAVTGTGKTLVGLLIAKFIGGRIVVSSHRNSILDHWKREQRKWGLEHLNMEYMTFHKASKPSNIVCDLLIIDEAHRSTSEVFSNLYDNIGCNNLLALTGTPTRDVYRLCGKEIIKVDYKEANVCSFTVVFHAVKLNSSERSEYDDLTKKIRKLYQVRNNTSGAEYGNISRQIKNIVLKRRSLVYEADTRYNKCIELTEKLINHKDRKVIIFTQRKEHANTLQKVLNRKGVDSIVYHSSHMGDLDAYRNGDVNVCITVGMLTEGFDDRDTDAVIVMSTALSEQYHLQTIGRGIRFKEGKDAEIHVLVALDTTDEEVLRHALDGRYHYRLEGIKEDFENIEQRINKKEYYRGKIYTVTKKREIKDSKGNYYKWIPRLDVLFELKPYGGKISVSDTATYTRYKNMYLRVFNDPIYPEPAY